ncbi:helix-turn-helix domain-containing protein [Hyperthermus butylicus]|uniref:HTHelix DNA binding n=1 Tax=Hyperthermus butylicus (strain DSM 5456 / JCM 9403 / PLM1-5) TaxID=415426 RepID=A2BJB8_HYPBU|nr:helix-turn-helix domain-containing protein [Hyperthermus butylicus]ABM80079.1 HTHelix DNA binding [Hyperthermus butylicus DSM 5456]
MATEPLLVLAAYRGSTRYNLIRGLLAKAEAACSMDGYVECRIGEQGESIPRPVLAARIYQCSCWDDGAEIWARVSGEPPALEALKRVLRQEKGLGFQVLSETKYSIMLRLVSEMEQSCGLVDWCPFTKPIKAAMVRTVICTSRMVLVELIVAKASVLHSIEEAGFEIIYRAPLNSVEHSLTAKQEAALVLAYLYGYYSYPRRISVKGLASKLGISSSALAELLRRAELKIITRYILEELPHYLLRHYAAARMAEERRRASRR